MTLVKKYRGCKKFGEKNELTVEFERSQRCPKDT
jgi:hypothetical protein